MSRARSTIRILNSTARLVALGMLTALAACSGGGGTGQSASAPATMQSIEVTPNSAHVAAGTTTQFTATAIFSDSTHRDITSKVAWASSNMHTATVSNGGLASGLSAGSTMISASSAGMMGQTTLAVTPALLTAIEVTPPSPKVAKGTTAQFQATGVFSDKSTQNLTSQVTWVSSDPTVATISSATGSAGLASAAGTGVTHVSATLGSVSSPAASLTVTAATLVSIQLTPPSRSIAKGLSQQFTATGIFTDNSTQDLSSMVTWESSDTSIATISNMPGSAGLAFASSAGSSSISASLGTVTSPMASLTVTPATLVSIQVTPPSPSIANGLTEQFTATGVYTDKSTQDLTTAVTWASDTASVASISNAGGSNGVATASGVGTSNISATLNGVTSPNAVLTVTAATLVAIQVTPPSPSIANGLTEQFTATGVYTDSSTQDLTTTVTWASDTASVASISNAGGSNGLATTAGVGTSNISATLNGVTSPNAVLTVTAATLVSLQVTPPSPSIAKGLTQQFTAIGVYTDNSKQDLTTSVTWASDTAGVASISNAGGSNGVATAAGVGTSNISAALNGVTSPSAVLTVTAATLVSIQVAPSLPTVAKGLTQQFTAIGTYTDNSVQDLTTAVTWASDTASVASISNAAGSNGLATAAGVGTSNISATVNGVSSPAAVLTVTAASLVSIQVSPPSPAIAKGLTQQFAAIGTYTDSSTQDLTTAVTWASDTASVASISNAAGSNGLATAAGVGTSNISATLNGVTSPNAVLTVSAATLVSIQVAPSSATVGYGSTQQFTATGTYTDNSTQDLTAVVTWASSAGGVATISNAAGSNGLATSAGIGSTNISAGLNTVNSPAATLTVTAAATGVAGVWMATPAAGTTAFMISDGGDIFYYTSTSTCIGLYTGTLTVTGSTLSGAGEFTPDVLGPTSGCASSVHENFSGTVVPGASMSLTATPSGGGSPSTINWTFDALYDQASNLAMVAGTWTMPGGSTAVISSSGAITGLDATTSCTITGQLSIGDPTVDIYNVSASYSGCRGSAKSLNGVALTGLATLDASVTPNQLDVFLRSANKKTMAAFTWVQ